MGEKMEKLKTKERKREGRDEEEVEDSGQINCGGKAVSKYTSCS